ncbi:unnamed protein product [Ixodes persulcatus]
MSSSTEIPSALSGNLGGRPQEPLKNFSGASSPTDSRTPAVLTEVLEEMQQAQKRDQRRVLLGFIVMMVCIIFVVAFVLISRYYADDPNARRPPQPTGATRQLTAITSNRIARGAATRGSETRGPALGDPWAPQLRGLVKNRGA